jgi:Leucine-rich repeat (LRR) protein
MSLQIKGLSAGRTTEMLPAYQNLLDLYTVTDQTPFGDIERCISCLSSCVNKTIPDEMFESFSVVQAGYLRRNVEQLKQGVQWIVTEIFARLSESEQKEVRSILTHNFPPIATSLCAAHLANQGENSNKKKMLSYRVSENQKSGFSKQDTSSDFTVKLLKSLNQCTIRRREKRQVRLNQWIDEAAEIKEQYQQRIKFKEKINRFINDDTSTSLSFKGCQLTSLPKDFFGAEPFVSRVEVLDLSDNMLSELPEDLFYLKSLRQIFIGNNLLVRSTPDVLRLKSLAHLNVVE